jgi:histidinol-phosphate aminotransferase
LAVPISLAPNKIRFDCNRQPVRHDVASTMPNRSYHELAVPHVLSKGVYEPGKPIEIVALESGKDAASILKLASNENPLGPSPLGLARAREALGDVSQYPEDSAWFLREKIAEKRDLDPAEVIVGHGSSGVIEMLCQAFAGPGRTVVTGEHAFIAYKLFTLQQGAQIVEVPLREFRHDLEAMLAAVRPDTSLVFLPSPNNPTGTANTAPEIVAFAKALPEKVIFCFDEAYAEYLDDPVDLRPLIAAGRKIFCTRTFSKIFGLAGLRIGYGYGDRELIRVLHQVRPPFNVNSAALAAALGALEDDDYVARSRTVNREGLTQLYTGLKDLGLDYVPSAGNFVLVRFEDSGKVFQYLYKDGIIVRPLQGYALPDHLRISVGKFDQNRRLLDALARGAERGFAGA